MPLVRVSLRTIALVYALAPAAIVSLTSLTIGAVSGALVITGIRKHREHKKLYLAPESDWDPAEPSSV